MKAEKRSGRKTLAAPLRKFQEKKTGVPLSAFPSGISGFGPICLHFSKRQDGDSRWQLQANIRIIQLARSYHGSMWVPREAKAPARQFASLQASPAETNFGGGSLPHFQIS